ncbi:COX15/CtaA family protein [Anaerobacillus sp. MEB173]|uniref:COX15/CtaA family protein n=1 Tax=Anaerobacillus sp. MEB173 TaxID=3383345 RepID=UPI003F9191D2
MGKLVKLYAVITTIGMLIVLLQGALVTKTESGEGCGKSWPLCHDQVIPDVITLETVIEYSHRAVSGLLGIMVIILAIVTWKKIPHVRETKFLAVIAVLFIVFQGLLGAAAVMWGQSSAVLALHFGFSLISFASVLLLTILLFEENRPMQSKVPKITLKFRNFIYFTIIYAYIVVYTGAYVRHTGSSLACSGWPLCNGQVIPSLTGIVGVQFGHRVAAALLFIAILYLAYRSFKNYRNQDTIFWTSILALILVTLQVMSGAVVVFTLMNLYASLLHALIISLLFGVLSYLTMLATRVNIK